MLNTSGKKNIQVTCRLAPALYDKCKQKLSNMGFTTLAEYIRHLIMNDTITYEGYNGSELEEALSNLDSSKP